MNKQNTLFLSLLMGVAGLFSSMQLEARTYVDVNIAPPPPRYEPAPPAHYGYVWAPGYWRWNGHRYVWASGHWIRERHGYRWRPHHWVAHNGRWSFEEGRWEHGQ